MCHTRTASTRFLVIALLFALNACGAPQQEVTQPTAVPATATAAAPAAAVPATAAPIAAPTAADSAPTDAATEPTAVAPKGDNSQPTSDQGDANASISGAYLADLGFRPEANGFSFENYGGDTGSQDLTSDDLRRMFGDQVCASQADDKCILTPAGQQWMEQTNQSMSGGHCEGMAALSLLLYTNKEKADDFGGSRAFDLQIASNEKLQREIAYWWATQAVRPTASSVIKGTPNEIVDHLIKAFGAGKDGADTYTIGIYKRDGSGGHAVTPYAVEDRGNGIFWIMVYDNNYPGIARNMEVDRNANTWRYTASTNPSEPADEYEGDAQTESLDLTPSSARLPQQACPFCEASATSRVGGLAAPAPPQYNQIWLDGDADLLITDQQGRRYGFVDGKLLTEIPGVASQNVKLGVDVWEADNEPVYFVPLGVKFTITVDGRQLEKPGTAEVLMIGPGYDLEVSDIKLEPGQVDMLDVSPDGSQLSYKTDSGESPDITLGIETTAADYAFFIKGVDIEPGGTINIGLDMAKGHLSLDTTGNQKQGTYALFMDRIDDDGEQIFGHEEITLEAKDSAYVDFLKWTGNQASLPVELDYGSDGTIDETIELPDQTDTVSEGQ